jgi:hypothetical protein
MGADSFQLADAWDFEKRRNPTQAGEVRQASKPSFETDTRLAAAEILVLY